MRSDHYKQSALGMRINVTILLVDDDPLQAFVRKSALEKHFPDVRRVKDPTETLCLVEQPLFAQNLALVISAQHMPGFGKADFVDELHTRMPNLPVLVLGDETAPQTGSWSDHLRWVSATAGTAEMVRLAGEMIALSETSAA